MTRLIKFMLPSCVQCKALDPVLKKILEENPKVVFSEINAMEGDAASGYNVTRVPTLVVQKDGVEVGRIDHMTDASSIRRLLAAAE